MKSDIERIKRYLIESGAGREVSLGDKPNISFLAQGEYNKNYVVENEKNKYVFRINNGSQIGVSNQIEYEYRALKRLEESGYTPKAYYVDGSRRYLDRGVLIMEFLEGKPLNYNKDLKKAGDIFSGIHSLEVKREDFDYLITENYLFSDRLREGRGLLTKFWSSPHIDIEVKRYFERYIEWCERNAYRERYYLDSPWRAINNTEVNSHNFIIGEKSYLIDWEKPVISDPCQDITQFLAPTTTLWKGDSILTREQIDSFYREYEKRLPNMNIRDRVEMYNPYLYLRALSWCAYAYVEYQDPDKDIKNKDTYEKIKEYLDIDFMKKLLKNYID